MLQDHPAPGHRRWARSFPHIALSRGAMPWVDVSSGAEWRWNDVRRRPAPMARTARKVRTAVVVSEADVDCEAVLGVAGVT